ncbi:SAM-dependent methyltransferase [Actinomadura xylanilytica]|uniref:SAM-dependent methyltransferase n=1 Tax=Actinomadura xylanilytica TaxID=887459 RepID=UPI00255B2934|nr:SAM-dependent methyltransferase [Actinomadura xylanilytica]MDL4773120.1 SAM-dependent methyltransferase [Actinomadura xylanilytica]
MTDGPPDPAQGSQAKINTDVPQSARIWNYWLGGTDNYEVDRAAGDQYVALYPGIVEIARSGRYFMDRAIRYLAGEHGIRQFMDCGTGLPTLDNTHEMAQRAAPDSHIVYVDNDPLVLAHARALLTSTPEGTTTYIDASLHDPDAIMERAAAVLDLSKPVALLLVNVMGHIVDPDEALAVARGLLRPLASGSFLILDDCTDTHAGFNAAQKVYDDTGAIPFRLRSPEFIAGYFDGLEPVEPGLVQSPRWRPEVEGIDTEDLPTLCGVARKP